MKLKISKIHPQASLPRRETSGAGAYDVRAAIDKTVIVSPGQRAAIATGLKVEVPPGYILSVRPRSGLAIKQGVTLVNSPGTIDSDFRGEIKILVINLSDKDFEIQNGDRIAQWLLEAVIPIEYEETEAGHLSVTDRGEAGFGSTGKH